MTSIAGSFPDQERRILTVSQLTALIKQVLETSFPAFWVEGELFDVSRPKSGHLYFTLKDANAQIRGVMWRSALSKLKFIPQDGQHVVCQASLDVYPPRGSYQVVCRRIEPVGVGALQLALQQLQAKLAAEGLFDRAHKKKIPMLPRCIGLITSPTGAAVRDFLEVIRRRWSGAHVLLFPVRVQGEGAAQEVAAAIATANRLRNKPDVLVVTRGGGSLEDLWCFNEELVVRAVYKSRIPVVSAIGHEIDVTLCDLAADVRALTPSEAAERVAPAQEDIQKHLGNLQRNLQIIIRRRLDHARQTLQSFASRPVLRRPFELLFEPRRRVDELEMRMGRRMEQLLSRHKQHLDSLAARLQSLSPLRVLARGYSVTSTEDGHIIRTADEVQVGERIHTQLAEGRLVSQVERIESGET